MHDLLTLSPDAQPSFGSTRHFGSVSEPRPPNDCSPWVRPFPPRLPPGVASPCSVASQVLWPHPTSHPRTCSACGLSLGLDRRGHRGARAGAAQPADIRSFAAARAVTVSSQRASARASRSRRSPNQSLRLLGTLPLAQELLILGRVVALQSVESVVRRVGGGNADLLLDCSDV